MNAPVHERFMALAIEEARKGLGRTHPNPAVGAVIVKGGKVVATGFHARAGAPHAEAAALAIAGARARGATLYSTLEPCNHHGRTPPCTEAIIAAAITRVVYASPDPNPLVNGQGHQRLELAGVEVVSGVLRGSSDALNRPFYKAVTTGMPFVTLKAGITLDGKIALKRGEQTWITSDQSVTSAHQLRNLADVVVVGAGTVASDDPHLTTRIPGGRTPVRLVLDSGLKTPPQSAVFDTRAGRTIVATLEDGKGPRARRYLVRGVEVWTLPARRGRVALTPLLRRLAGEGLLSVLVEGGAEVHASFLSQRLADQLILYMAPLVFGHPALTWTAALPAPGLKVERLEVERLGPDLVLRADLHPAAVAVDGTLVRAPAGRQSARSVEPRRTVARPK